MDEQSSSEPLTQSQTREKTTYEKAEPWLVVAGGFSIHLVFLDLLMMIVFGLFLFVGKHFSICSFLPVPLQPFSHYQVYVDNHPPHCYLPDDV